MAKATAKGPTPEIKSMLNPMCAQTKFWFFFPGKNLITQKGMGHAE